VIVVIARDRRDRKPKPSYRKGRKGSKGHKAKNQPQIHGQPHGSPGRGGVGERGLARITPKSRVADK
jgi:hypothetical protein